MAPKATKTALSKAPGAKLAQNLQRVSPGVYRNASGQLTNSGGRPMPGQASRVPSPSVGAIQGAARAARAGLDGYGKGGMGAARGVLEGAARGIGGSIGGGRNMPGGFNQGMAQGIGAAFGGNMGEQSDFGYQLTPDQMEQTRQAEYQAFVEQQRAMGAANMGEQLGGMAGGFAQGMGQGFGMGKGPAQPGLEEQARARAEAIASGGAVSMDYNQQRDALVNQMLPGMRQNMPQEMGQALGMPGQKPPSTVSGLLQRGPAPRSNPFQNMMQGMGGKKPIPY